MTIKAFVLDTLSKFLTKLKSTYFTPMRSDIDTLNAHDVSDLGTAIPGDADLDNYTTPGRYYAVSTTSIGHFPLTGSASISMDMIVMPRASSARARQILFAYLSTQQFAFMRSMTGESSWGEWTRLTDTPQLFTDYASFYTAIVQLASTSYTKPMAFNIGGSVSSIITGGKVNVSLRGVFVIADYSQHIIDVMAMDGTNGTLHAFRTTLTSNAAATVQIYNRSFMALGSTVTNATVQCQNAGDATRLVTQSFSLGDNLSSYDIVQFIVCRDGLKVLGRRRSDSTYEHVSVAPSLAGGTLIAASTNLNSLTTLGTYYCPQNDTVATLSNCPTNVAFTMQVSYGTGTGYVAQSIHEYNSAKTYFRSMSGGSWSTWYTPAQSITGGASSIATSNLTANRALVSNSSGKVGVSAVTSTELGYLDGVTSAIQTQINNLSTKLTSYMKMQYVQVTIPANSNNVAVTATVDTGYSWIGWAYCASVSWIGHCYPAANTASTTIWTSNGTSSSARKVNCFYITRK